MRRRTLDETDERLWRAVTATVAPLYRGRAAPGARPSHDPAAFAHPVPLAPPPKRHPKPAPAPLAPGLDGDRLKRIARDEIRVDARIDLHGLTLERAHRALEAFVETCARGGLRTLLVITGKGAPGALKAEVPRWLAERPFQALVAGHAAAAPRHGAAGALYVFLRRRAEPGLRARGRLVKVSP